MHLGQRFWCNRGLGVKLALTNFLWVSLILALLVMLIAWGVTRILHDKLQAEMEQGIHSVGQFIEASDKSVRQETQRLAEALAERLEGSWSLISTFDGPELRVNGRLMSGNNAFMERFTQDTGAVATLFIKQADGNFLRVASSLKNEQGEPLVNTLLDSDHPALQAVATGNDYLGIASLVGREYMTHYRVLKDNNGAVVGLAFVGQDFSELISSFKAAIRSLKVGETGYTFVLYSGAGPRYGELEVHPSSEGRNLINPQDGTAGFDFAKEILEKKQGVIEYDWMDSGTTTERAKMAVFGIYEPWNWVYASSTYIDEFTASARSVVLAISALGLGAVTLLSLVWWWLARHMIVRPLKEVSRMAHAIAAGDLSMRIAHDQEDEIGRLVKDINKTADELEKVVRLVHTRANGVSVASLEIAQSNQDLANRTESSASALTETSSAMEQLGGTVANNADHARLADELTREAERVVTMGGEAVREVAQTMRGIHDSSQQISNITGVIDGIAFQTNILALNAAVEAARAGEHGRGFAVVASEVRSLAQRSADAAREIANLITSSVDEIDQGNQRASHAGDTMEQAIAEIQKVTRLISDISDASAEQSTGVIQVAEAVSNMDSALQQNAAMVEEMAAAANSLSEQADELVKSVAVFRV